MSALAKFSAANRRGLIEASGMGLWTSGRMEFSAANRRGLIEAIYRIASSESSRTFSAANRRGLIEAWLSLSFRWMLFDIFRGESPRPH